MDIGDLVMEKRTGRLGIVEGFGRGQHVNMAERQIMSGELREHLVKIMWADTSQSGAIVSECLEVISDED